ncbi:peptidyl-prolyl cis-trans isomerase [Paenibacillus sp. HWE-109]|uniref:peptidyl-prolyl cis-trans isomerase n=1 Tax=Paenibacillus sp. HWE-109 TaxID=1306526 RepID=UPI001EDF847F|nr:peptidyl-prolyl cis-trans isomerase [Paenibacillus sp. HWE-109]UKS26901.1 peptidyl-prolyl cis-trans isomerase [Paenibacillus sp. HWE-109]
MKPPSAHFRQLFLLLCICGIFMVTGCGVHTTPANGNPTVPIATVNGAPLQIGEFRLFAQKLRSGVIQTFVEKYRAQYGKDFWNTSYGEGGTPQEYLKQTALKEAIVAKIIQLLARENDLVDKIDYSDFAVQFQKENMRREEAIKNKEPIYGPVQYEEAAYYEYWMSNLKLQTIQKLASDSSWNPNDEEIQAYYEANVATMFHQPDMYSFNKITLPLDDRQEAYKKAQNAKEVISKGKAFELVAQAYNDSGEVEKGMFNPRKIMEPGIDDEGFLKLLQGLREGEVSDIWEERDSLQIIQLAERIHGGDKPLEEVRDVVKSAIIEQKLNQWVSDQAKAAKVELTSSYRQFTLD